MTILSPMLKLKINCIYHKIKTNTSRQHRLPAMAGSKVIHNVSVPFGQFCNTTEKRSQIRHLQVALTVMGKRIKKEKETNISFGRLVQSTKNYEFKKLE